MNTPTHTRRRISRRRRLPLRWIALVAIVGGVAAFIASTVAPRNSTLVAKPVDATVCTTCMSVTGPTTSPVLYPGAPASTMPVTFTNTTNGPIYVTQLQVGLTNLPSTCPVTNFKVGDSSPGATVTAATTASNTATITYSPAQTIPAGQAWTDNTTLQMVDTHASQDACRNLGLSFTYAGTANYTVLTATALSTSSNASADTETLTATISPDIQPLSAAHTPGAGDGSVTFYSCTGDTASSCANNPLGTSLLTGPGTATLTTPAGAVGSYKLEAVYAPSDPTNFVTSTSQIITENLTGCVAAQTMGATQIIRAGQSVNGLTVASGTSAWLDGGTISGNVTIASGGQFAASGGTINGSVTSSGGPIAMANTIVTGNVQNTSGGLALGPQTNIKGNAQASGGGPFCSQGTTNAPVQVRGNLQVQSLTSATTSSVCSTTVGNNLLWQSNASPGLIGSCGGNTVLGNLNVQSNTGSVTIGAGGSGNTNTVSGNTSVSGNTGGGTLTGNQITGNCTMSGDKPGIVGSGNTTGKGNNQCNTTAAGA